MKTLRSIVLPYLILFLASTSSLLPQDHTYILEITSLDELVVEFELELSTIQEATAEPVVQEFRNLETPFVMNLESGEYVIIVRKTNDKGQIQSKIIGVVGGQEKGFASCDDRRARLTAGPGGRWSATAH